MTGRELSEALRAGRRVYATLVISTSPLWPAAIAGVGVDFAFIDTEHMPIDRAQCSWMCQTYAALGIAPIVRIPRPDPYEACKVLDGGASGIIAPYVETAEEARALRGAVKLRPLKGARLRDVLARDAEPDPALSRYLAERNAGSVLILNIESMPAIEALDSILAVPGVDAVLVGPHDLSCSLGVPEQYDHPRFLDAVSAIIRKARAARVGVGVHFSTGMAHEIRWGKEGANLIVHSSDLVAVRQTLGAEFRELREAMGDASNEAKAKDVVV